MKYILFLCALLAALPASAHVKWFVHASPYPDVVPYSVTEPSVLVWIGVVILFLVTGFFLHKRLPILPIPLLSWSNPSRPRIIRITTGLFGAWLLLNVVTNAAIAPTHQSLTINILQAIAGTLLLIGFWPKIAATILAILWATSVVLLGPDFFDALYMLGIAQLVAYPHEKTSLTWVRVTIGIALCITAFNEKLLVPEMAQAFLLEHPWNFMTWFGFNYPDRLFILSAGMMEIVFGALLITGWVTRLTILGLAPVLLLTAIILGLLELLGHMPIFIIAFLLVLYGNPEQKKTAH